MRRYDVIVVLGASVWPGGRASPALARRVRHAADLFHAGVAARVLATGGHGRHLPTEAEVMARLLREAGVPAAALLLETQARTTFESALFCRRLLAAHGLERVLIVTDAWHLRRSLMVFRGLGVAADGSAVAEPAGATPVGRRLYRRLRERAGLAWYVLRLARHRRRPKWPG